MDGSPDWDHATESLPIGLPKYHCRQSSALHKVCNGRLSSAERTGNERQPCAKASSLPHREAKGGDVGVRSTSRTGTPSWRGCLKVQRSTRTMSNVTPIQQCMMRTSGYDGITDWTHEETRCGQNGTGPTTARPGPGRPSSSRTERNTLWSRTELDPVGPEPGGPSPSRTERSPQTLRTCTEPVLQCWAGAGRTESSSSNNSSSSSDGSSSSGGGGSSSSSCSSSGSSSGGGGGGGGRGSSSF